MRKLFVLLLVLSACGGVADGTDVRTSSGSSASPPAPSVNMALPQLDAWLDGVRAAETKAFLDADHKAKVAAAQRRRQQRAVPEALHAAAAAPATPGVYLPVSYDHACGGDLPPCSILDTESGGNIRVWNKPRGMRGACYAPVGWAGSRSPCGGSTASGKWQFLRSTWNGYGGYLNAADAPASVQNAKARELWAGGRGCSHWSACG